MRILVKYPTRSRPTQFIRTLHGWLEGQQKGCDIHWLFSFDLDDETATVSLGDKAASLCDQAGSKATYVHAESQNKIHAINRDIGVITEPWDILMVVSDDMWCRRKGWDVLVEKEMEKAFSDTDGFIWMFDGAQKQICTLPIMGRKLYDRFGYVYNPQYESFFCDNEQTEVVERMGKCAKIPYAIATHEHPAWCAGMKQDELYRRNNSAWHKDQALYNARKASGFK